MVLERGEEKERGAHVTSQSVIYIVKSHVTFTSLSHKQFTLDHGLCLSYREGEGLLVDEFYFETDQLKSSKVGYVCVNLLKLMV